MNVTSFPQQVGWLGGKRLDLHPWGFKDQSSQIAWVLVNVKMLIEYSLPT
jgi:hypothetical protein